MRDLASFQGIGCMVLHMSDDQTQTPDPGTEGEPSTEEDRSDPTSSSYDPKAAQPETTEAPAPADGYESGEPSA